MPRGGSRQAGADGTRGRKARRRMTKVYAALVGGAGAHMPRSRARGGSYDA
jgi:hypothetical protein